MLIYYFPREVQFRDEFSKQKLSSNRVKKYCVKLLCFLEWLPLSSFKQTKIENWTDAMLCDIAVRVLGAQGPSLAAFFLPNTQPCEHTWPSSCILYLPSFNKERVISEYVCCSAASFLLLSHTHTKLK